MSTNSLAQINKAEQALASASDIIDILELRTKAKAVEVVALAQGFGEVAQKAKIFQLKAERKAGGWLDNNIQHGGNSRSHSVTLADLEISKSQSSRWQLIATVPDDKFHTGGLMNAWQKDRRSPREDFAIMRATFKAGQ